MFKCSSTYRFLLHGNVDFIKARNRNLFRFFSNSSHNTSILIENEQIANFTSEKENEVFLEGPKRNIEKTVSRAHHSGKLFYINKRNSEIIAIIKRNDENMESNLNSITPSLSHYSIIEIFEALNCHRISGLRFFRWAINRDLELNKKAIFYSAIINNCGWLKDYKTMESLLLEFRQHKICLTEKAFEFIPRFGSTKEYSIQSLMNLLNKIGGSCRNSGIHVLIHNLCVLGLFDLAKFVIKITEKSTSYYNILIREKCTRGEIQEPDLIINEMFEFGCKADTNSYNFILGNLCKHNRFNSASILFEKMKENNILPDSITYEILIYSFCGVRNFERVFELMNEMVLKGIKPRFTTRSVIIKSLFNDEKFDEAYKYVIEDSISSNLSYDLLVKLYQTKDLITAMNILIEMMDKGLKPNSRVYSKVISRLRNSGKGCLADEVKIRYNKIKSL